MSGALSIAQSGPSADGYLAQTDWNSFNARLSTSSLGLVDKGYFFSTTSAIYFASASTSIAKTYSNNTFTGSNTFSGATIANGGLTVGSLTGLLYGTNGSVGTIATTSRTARLFSLSALAPAVLQRRQRPVLYIAISTTTNGYLSSADFNTFNNKISSTSLSATGPLSYSPSTGLFTIAQSGPATDGYLSQGDWNSFNIACLPARSASSTRATSSRPHPQHTSLAESKSCICDIVGRLLEDAEQFLLDLFGLVLLSAGAGILNILRLVLPLAEPGQRILHHLCDKLCESSTTIPKTYSANTSPMAIHSPARSPRTGLTVARSRPAVWHGRSVGTVATNTLGLLGSTSISLLARFRIT